VCALLYKMHGQTENEELDVRRDAGNDAQNVFAIEM
jgi:hypothetical protein